MNSKLIFANIRKIIGLYKKIVENSSAAYLIFISLTILNLIGFPLPIAKRVKNAYSNKLLDIEENYRDIYLVSAYFYSESRSVHVGQVSIILIGSRDAEWERRYILLAGSNENVGTIQRIKLKKSTPHNLCEHVTLVGSVPLLENLKNLELIVSDNISSIPFKYADNIPRDLVICTPPIYNTPNWKNLIFRLHTYKRFGALLQIYFSEANTPFFDFLKYFSNQDMLKLDSFPNFADKLELGGLSAANNDCLYKYKDSANFITFLNFDDFLLPINNDGYLLNILEQFEKQQFVAILDYKITENHRRIIAKTSTIDRIWMYEPVETPYKMRRISPTDSFFIRKDITNLGMLKNVKIFGNVEEDIEITASDREFKRILKNLQHVEIFNCSNEETTTKGRFSELICPRLRRCQNV